MIFHHQILNVLKDKSLELGQSKLTLRGDIVCGLLVLAVHSISELAKKNGSAASEASFIFKRACLSVPGLFDAIEEIAEANKEQEKKDAHNRN